MAESKTYPSRFARPGPGRGRLRAASMPGSLLDRLILSRLEASEVPQSAYQLVSALRELGHQLPATSVYRALDRLRTRGAIDRVETFSAYRLRDKPEALLMICLQCGRAASLSVPHVHEELGRLLADRQFVPSGVAIEAHGRCPDCQGLQQGAERS